MAMNPNPKSFPILSYVMARLPSRSPRHATSTLDNDLEQANASPSKSALSGHSTELVTQMPHLSHPRVLESMKKTVTDVAQARSVLRTLGPRPDHEAIDQARLKMAEIESSLTKSFEVVVLSPRSVDAESQESDKEHECREAAEKEKSMYESILKLDEMHDAYEKMLSESEARLVKIYESAERSAEGEEEEEEDSVHDSDEINEDVVRILQEASEKTMERIDLSRKLLKLLPEEFGKIQGLLVLNLSNNLLKTIPDSIAGLQSLEEFNLSANHLESLPDSIGLLLNLKLLDVSGNKLQALPDAICHCRSLVELDASFNRLHYLPTNIGLELLNLKRLSVHLNKIRSLPTSVGEMESLCHLDAHFNELHCLPPSIGKLINLEILNLGSNFSDLTELPDTIGDLVNLKELDLSNNQVHALPRTFGKLEKLKKLNLELNPIVIPPPEVVKEGIEAIRIFMNKWWFDQLALEEKKHQLEEADHKETGWLTRSTSMVKTYVSGVSESVSEYIAGNSPRDPYLDRQL